MRDHVALALLVALALAVSCLPDPGASQGDMQVCKETCSPSAVDRVGPGEKGCGTVCVCRRSP